MEVRSCECLIITGVCCSPQVSFSYRQCTFGKTNLLLTCQTWNIPVYNKNFRTDQSYGTIHVHLPLLKIPFSSPASVIYLHKYVTSFGFFFLLGFLRFLLQLGSDAVWEKGKKLTAFRGCPVNAAEGMGRYSVTLGIFYLTKPSNAYKQHWMNGNYYRGKKNLCQRPNQNKGIRHDKWLSQQLKSQKQKNCQKMHCSS